MKRHILVNTVGHLAAKTNMKLTTDTESATEILFGGL